MNIALKYPPRLARLYGEDIKRLETIHAGRLFPGARTWEAAIDGLFDKMCAAGPAKGARVLEKATGYLDSIDPDQRAHLVLVAGHSSRAALLMFAAFAIGQHPDPAVDEEGLVIQLRILKCGRARSSHLPGIPVAFVSMHAVRRLFERGCDIVDNKQASNIFAFVAALGHLLAISEKHAGGGMALAFDELLLVGGMHKFSEATQRHGEIELSFFDVRTVLDSDMKIDPAQLEQGTIAAGSVLEWLTAEGAVDKVELVKLIPVLPRRDSYPARMAGAS